jgi:hypothetical protein
MRAGGNLDTAVIGVLRARPISSVRCSLASTAVILLAIDAAGAAAVATWTQWEHTLTSATSYANPYQQVTLTVTYTSASGESFRCYGFWDGGPTFRIRFMFPAQGIWTWKTACSDTGNTGLHEQSGTVHAVEYSGDNPLYRHGYLKVSDNHRYLVYADGLPFLWIGDTPWSVFVTATQEEWERYLQNRRDNKFTVVQVHCGGCWNWIGKLTMDRYGNPPFAGSGDSLRWNPAYWQQVDRKVQAANELGLLVYICAVRQPGGGFPVDDSDQVARFAQNLAARLMGNFVIYSPIADDLWTAQADAAGKSLDRATPMQLISAHPRFFLEPATTSHGKDYIDVVGLQTGEGWQHDPYQKEKPEPWSPSLAARNAIEWPLALYRLTPVKPVINQEGPYDHPPYTNNPEHPMPLPPRKAGYWSFLSGAPGLTYGCFGIWNWGRPVRWMPSYDYETALKVESAGHMKYMSEFFRAIAWWTLEPRHDLVLGQPGDWLQRMALAKSESGDLAVAYLPDNDEITVNMKAFSAPMRARWFNPMTGEYQAVWDSISVTDRHTFARPSGWQDAVLVLRKETDR